MLAAIVGAAGLAPTLAAARAGKRILLANKEALVIGGAAFMAAVESGGATLLPIDSEHNAIFQCLPRGHARDPGGRGVRRILLTASGGPFRTRPLAELATVTPDEACAHPNWVMGRKISVDSATMMNKGLEVIEAHWLFGVPRERDRGRHPSARASSIRWSNTLTDRCSRSSAIPTCARRSRRRSLSRTASTPAWPRSSSRGMARSRSRRPTPRAFPASRSPTRRSSAGGTAPAVLNAANEVAVAAFLDGRIRYTDIAPACAEALARLPARPVRSLDDALAADAEARARHARLAEAPR